MGSLSREGYKWKDVEFKRVKLHGQSTKERNSTASSTSPQNRPRICHLRKSPAFNGYGFDFNTKGGNRLQFVGKIDVASPAQISGLCSNDIIIEVNGMNVSKEDHQAILNRIREHPDHVKLLVVDQKTAKFYSREGIKITEDLVAPAEATSEVDDNSMVSDDDEDEALYQDDPWEGIGSEEGLWTWRISKGQASFWPFEEYGHFYDADVFIVLSSQQDKTSFIPLFPKLDIHVWVGKYASQKDYLTAVRKAVELDERLQKAATIYREAQGKESELFKSYFNPITVWRGTCTDSWRASKGELYAARMLKFYRPDKRRINYRAKEVPLTVHALDQSHIFILDIGHQLYQWNGSAIPKDDLSHAIQYMGLMKANRGLKCQIEMVDEEDCDSQHPISTYMGNSPRALDNDMEDQESVTEAIVRNGSMQGNVNQFLYSMTFENSGQVSLSRKKTGTIHTSDLKSQNTYLFDTGFDCYVWIGTQSRLQDKKAAFECVHTYLKTSDHTLAPVTILQEGHESSAINRALGKTYN